MKNLLISTLFALSMIGGAVAADMKSNHAGFKLAKKGDLAGAEPHFLKALAADRNDPYALTNLGYLYEVQGKWGQAKEMYQRVIALNLKETKKPVVETTGGIDRPIGKADESGFVEPAVEPFNVIARRNLAGMDRMEKKMAARP